MSDWPTGFRIPAGAGSPCRGAPPCGPSGDPDEASGGISDPSMNRIATLFETPDSCIVIP